MRKITPLLVLAVCSLAVAANDAKVLGALRTLNAAEVTYQTTYGKGFACQLEQLGPARKGVKPSARAAGLISGHLASGRYAGYDVQLKCVAGDFQAIAIPSAGGSGPVYCIDKSAVVRTADSAEKCIREGTLPKVTP